MTQITHTARTAASLIGVPDLYNALRDAAVQGVAPLAEVLLALDRADPATAARLRSVDAGLLAAVQRVGAGQPAIATCPQVVRHLAGVAAAPMFHPDVAVSPTCPLLTAAKVPGMPAFSDRAFDAWFDAQGVPYGLGSYGEYRTVYQTDQFADAASPERRCVHLGIDVFAAAGTPVHAPLDGRVLHLTYNADPLDYGNTLILQHEFGTGEGGPVPFFTLYGHLGGSLPGLLRVGDPVRAGQLIGHLGDWHENGGWAAHVHFQVMPDMLAQTGGNFFGVGHQSLWDVWQSVCPDPNLILRIPADRFRVAAG